MVPGPVQAVMVAALNDDATEALQVHRYALRRAKLMRALSDVGFVIQHSEAGMYLWATSGNICRDDVAWLADLGILVAPGDFYGEVGVRFVRVRLIGTDECIDAACARLTTACQRN